MKSFLAALCAGALICESAAALDREMTADEEKALEIYRKLISFRTAEGQGKVPELAAYLAEEFHKAGFARKDVEIRRMGDTAGMIVRYRGDGSSAKPPILFLAHMDVVDALAADWELDPFALTEKDGFFVGRGATDNKYGVMNLAQTFIRLKTSGFAPTRDLIIVYTGDEETRQETTRALAADPELRTAEFALNSDAGGGALAPDGAPLAYGIQAAEKTYATFELTATNPGGHSSLPRADNAIYQLADALSRVRAHKFPIMWNPVTLRAFEASGRGLGGELGQDILDFVADPKPGKIAERIAAHPEFVGQLRTTCVATMLKAGHAENALPQSATATVNCRIFPGVEVDAVKASLKAAVADETIEIRTLDEPTSSPVSELREDVRAAVIEAVHARYPDMPVVPYMEAGATDGKEFRIAGVPTFAVSAIIMNSKDRNEHGLNEKISTEAFFGGLEHWMTIIQALAGAPEAQ
jgi:acetylornithine deacetylase/succinyl-diaminopimelate desuccinylase-like protein